MQGWYAQWLLDDLQELTDGWFTTPLYSGWDSTKNDLDTGELTGLVTARSSSDARVEGDIFSLSQACGGGGELIDEDEGGEGARREIWGTVDGLTPAAR